MRIIKFGIVGILLFVMAADYYVNHWMMYMLTILVYSIGLLLYVFRDELPEVVFKEDEPTEAEKKKEIMRFY